MSPIETTTTDGEGHSLYTLARATFLAWERLRVTYIAILGVVTIATITLTGVLNVRIVFMTIEGAIVANVAYFAGPTVDTYVRWLGYDRIWPRWVMFVGGTLLSVALAVGLLATELLPIQL